MEPNEVWDKQHDKYAKTAWINRPSLFSQWAWQFFPDEGEVLDLGCGQGQDSRFFAERGHSVVALDFSEKAIHYAIEKTPEELKKLVIFEVGDVSKPLDFNDDSFEIVYSHLGLHYFDVATTERIFSEVHRVLKDDGILAIMLNSTSDPEYDTGDWIEDNYFDLGYLKKRFFDVELVRHYTAEKFNEIAADANGETFKDRERSVSHLIRYVGKKR